MPTKTDRILSYLPFTFLASRRQSALRAVAGAVGNELQLGETSLARIMRSHWVDSADEGALLIDDLERIASMYGLAPLRDDAQVQFETVEQFRRRLKRYVRTLLDGRVTVRGLINVAAEILDVTVPEGDGLDAWWKRRQRDTIAVVARGEDAAEMIFGVPLADVRGVDAQPAIVQGTADLSEGVNLENGAILRMQLDEDPPATIDLAAGAAGVGAVPLDHIRDAINLKFPNAASHDGRFLTIRSAKTGTAGRIEFEDVEGDAAFAVFGVPAHIYTGSDARHAEVRSSVNLASGADLSRERFLRVVVDGKQLAEIDCASSSPGVTTLNDIRDAINQALGVDVASHTDGLLGLRSPTEGSAGSIFLQTPAAQSCTRKVLGTQGTFFLGSDARPATAAGVLDLSAGVDLSQRPAIRVSLDGGGPVTVNCAGANPVETTPDEIAAKLNQALGPGTARAAEGRIVLSSPGAGRTGQIVFQEAGEADALAAIFGFGPRVFQGTPALAASFEGSADLSDPDSMNFFAQYRLGLIVDDGPLVEVDFRQRKGLTPEQIAKTIDQTLGADIAFSKVKTVGLTSTITGRKSRIAIVPLEREVRRRFVTRAAIQDEAAAIVFGFPERAARGQLATGAKVASQIDLQFGVDLRTDRWLSVSVDGQSEVVDCAGPRARTTTVEEILDRLKAKFPAVGDPRQDRVRIENGRLTLISPTTGAGSRIAFHPVRIQDASDPLLKVPLGERRGQEAGRVIFTATTDLSKGIELAADAHVRIGVDAVSPVDVLLSAGSAGRKTLNEIVTAINGTIGATVASHDGRFLILASRERGAASKLVFETASGTDATRLLFGFAAPRSYQGEEATPAVIAGSVSLPALVDLRVARFLRVSVDGRLPFVIDCAPPNADLSAVPIANVVTAISTGFSAEADSLPKTPQKPGQGVAKLEDNRLVLSSTTQGAASRVAIEAHVAGDARVKLFGAVPDETRGTNPVPAEIVGEVALNKPVDLSRYCKLLLSVDDGRPVEIDIAGSAPEETTLEEIVHRINSALPGVASETAEGFLRLRTVSAGPGSTLEVLPRRYIELIEHPVFDQYLDAGVVHEGEPVPVHNSGVEDSVARVEVTSLNGTVDPAVVNHFAGRKIGSNEVLRPGEKVVFEQDGEGRLQAVVISVDGGRRVIPESELDIENADRQPAGAGLELPRGDSTWTFVECLGPRFNEARFDAERYPGVTCKKPGRFDLSLWNVFDGPDLSVFAPKPLPEASASLRFDWQAFQGGAFELNLPAELRPVFGGRFNEARFGLGTVEKEGNRVARVAEFQGVVFDPKSDPDYIVTRSERGNVDPADFVVEASDVLTNVPLGFAANKVPFRTPRFLTRGDDQNEARLFLLEADSNRLIELKAAGKGAWGNQISVAVRPDGPGRYQIEIGFAGDRFEGARSLVLGPPEEADIKAAPGVLRAKAAGVGARVTRESAGD